MYEDDEKYEARKRKFYKKARLFIFIALAVASGNLISASISNYMIERELKAEEGKLKEKIKSDLQQMDKEFNELISNQKSSFTEQEKRRQQQQIDKIKQQVKDADCDFWIGQSRIEKTNEAMAERLRTCKEAGRQGY